MPSTSKAPSVKPVRSRSRWSVAIILGVVAVASTVALRHSPGAVEGATHHVAIENMRFTPEAIEVRVGDRIEFKNLDFVPHTATSTTKQIFDSGTLKSGESWTLTCREVGVADYRCIFHPVMTGSINVLPRR